MRSIRITVPAVLTASTLPTLSTEKYLIVYWPEVLSKIEVPVWVVPWGSHRSPLA